MVSPEFIYPKSSSTAGRENGFREKKGVKIYLGIDSILDPPFSIGFEKPNRNLKGSFHEKET
jgi:hypothetical protein